MTLPSRPFFFLRHGQTDWNAQSRIQGRTDTPLNAVGVAQAQSAAERFVGRGVARLVSSPLTRALRTAATVAERLSLPIHIDSDLQELHFGAFEGRVEHELRREHGIAEDQPVSSAMPPDGEQWPETAARVARVFNRWMAQEPAAAVLFVSHGGVFRALHQQLIGSRPAATNGAPYHFVPSPQGWSVSEIKAGE